MTPWSITHISPSLHAAHNPACASKGNWGFYQGTWITSVSINKEQPWVGVKSVPADRGRVHSRHWHCSSITLVWSSWANARKSQSWQQPDCTPEHASLQGQSQKHFCVPQQGWKVKALHLVKHREQQVQKWHGWVGNPFWNSLWNSFSKV